MARLKEDSHGATSVADVNEERFDWHWVKMAFKAPQTWLSSLIWFFLLVPLYVRSPQLPFRRVLLLLGKPAFIFSDTDTQNRASPSFFRPSSPASDIPTPQRRSYLQYRQTWQPL